MPYNFKRINKYEVMKLGDIEKYLSQLQKEELKNIIQTIQACRQLEDKEPCNSYVVVNEDEPYAEEVWRLIQKEEERKHKDD